VRLILWGEFGYAIETGLRAAVARVDLDVLGVA